MNPNHLYVFCLLYSVQHDIKFMNHMSQLGTHTQVMVTKSKLRYDPRRNDCKHQRGNSSKIDCLMFISPNTCSNSATVLELRGDTILDSVLDIQWRMELHHFNFQSVRKEAGVEMSGRLQR